MFALYQFDILVFLLFLVSSFGGTIVFSLALGDSPIGVKYNTQGNHLEYFSICFGIFWGLTGIIAFLVSL